MFLYTSDFSSLTHYIIEHFVKNKNIAIDATLGNGYDTNFLSEKFKNVIAFDIQKEACEKYLEHKNSNVTIINDSHNKFKEYINSKSFSILKFKLSIVSLSNFKVFSLPNKWYNSCKFITICL